MFIMNFKEIHSNAEFLSMYRIVGQGLAPAESILINYNLKNGLNSMFKPFLALFAFCSEE